MKINEKEFNKSAELLKGVRLTEAEKSAMLSNIYQTEIAPEPSPVASPFIFSSMFMRDRVMVALASFVLILTGGGYAAAGSLPGDPLYGIKVNVLEPLALGLTFDESAKDEYKIELLQRRVAELQELRLNADVNLASEEESYHAAERNIAELEACAVYDNNGINVEIEASVNTYNSLISEPFHLETRVMKDILIPTSEEEPTEDEEENNLEEILQRDSGKIEGIVAESLDEIDDDVKDTKSTVEKEIKEKIEDVTNPITESLGF